jgi:hypothetical protein
MAIESILVSFQGYSSTQESLVASLGAFLPMLRNRDAEITATSSCWVLDDGVHKFELDIPNKPIVFSLRFALCNPKTIDAIFFRLIKSIMAQHHLSMRFCEDCEDVPESFTTTEMIDTWQEPIQRCIDSRRQLWHHEFGKEERPATSAEAFQYFILPRCQGS